MTGILLSVGLMFVSVSILTGSMANQLKFKALEEKIKLVSQISNFIAGNIYQKAEELLRLKNIVGQIKSLGDQYNENYRSDLFASEVLRLLTSEIKLPYYPVVYNGRSAEEWYEAYCEAILKRQASEN